MKEKSPPKLSRLTKLGKTLAGLLAAAVALTVLYSFFFPKEEKLMASGVYIPFTLPLEAVRDLGAHQGSFQKNLTEVKKQSSGHVDLSLLDALQENETSLDKTANTLLDYKTLILVDIKNEGSKQAEHVSIELTNYGAYQIDQSSAETLSLPFRYSIPVGDLQPATSRRVFIWTMSPIIASEPKVTYTNGYIPVRFPQDAPSSTASPVAFAGAFLAAALLVLLSVVLLGKLGFPLIYYYVGPKQPSQLEPQGGNLTSDG